MMIDIDKKHKLYSANIKEWQFFRAAYDGFRALIPLCLEKHPREEEISFATRKKEAVGFDFSSGIVDILSHYLHGADIRPDLGERLASDPLWALFESDCDLYRTDFPDFFQEAEKVAQIYGHVGVLTTMPQGMLSEPEMIRKGVYPYVAMYTPENIWDWNWIRNKITNRPELSYLKLRNDEGIITVWERTWWETWKISDGEAKKIGEDKNRLGYIPFTFFLNIRRMNMRYMGLSTIRNISHMDASIIRNCSQGEQILNNTAFPILLHPWEEKDQAGNVSDDGGIDLGPGAVLGFDPEKASSKPEWLKSDASNDLDAVAKWIDRKSAATYRLANLGGMQATMESRGARSAEALAHEFSVINAALVKKGKNVAEAKRSVMKDWLAWRGKPEWFEDVQVDAPQKYDVENLAQSLENMLTAKSIVKADAFQKAIQKKVVRHTLPEIDDADTAEIFGQIDEGTPDMDTFIPPEEKDDI